MADSAASWLKSWKEVLSDSIKKLGKKGKMPRLKADPAAKLAKAVASAKTLDADTQKLLKGIREYQTLLITLQSEIYAVQGQIAKSDFGLSMAVYEEERIINKVRYEIDKCLSGMSLGAQTPIDYGFKIRKVLEGQENLTDF